MMKASVNYYVNIIDGSSNLRCYYYYYYYYYYLL